MKFASSLALFDIEYIIIVVFSYFLLPPLFVFHFRGVDITNFMNVNRFCTRVKVLIDFVEFRG